MTVLTVPTYVVISVIMKLRIFARVLFSADSFMYSHSLIKISRTLRRSSSGKSWLMSVVTSARLSSFYYIYMGWIVCFVHQGMCVYLFVYVFVCLCKKRAPVMPVQLAWQWSSVYLVAYPAPCVLDVHAMSPSESGVSLIGHLVLFWPSFSGGPFWTVAPGVLGLPFP